ncbi:hypothetical protein RVBP21_3430 [Pseudomonas phage BRkr]|nr:hypothetical protein RVBP21_3430 [Pseudomonas phage BRkr]
MDLMFTNPIAFIYGTLSLPGLLIMTGYAVSWLFVMGVCKWLPNWKYLCMFLCVSWAISFAIYLVMIITALVSVYTPLQLPPWTLMN